jgi:[acyl-carrier-protein] S-malonyltransferase
VVSQIKVKKAIPLKVSGAFHSHLMADAASEFAELLAPITFADAQMPVISNVEPTPTIQAAELKERLVRQMTGAVRWLEICQQLSTLGVTQVVEIGPGKVLTGLLKRTCPELELANIRSLGDS